MSLVDLAFFVPLMAAIALVLAITGAVGTGPVLREARARFLGLGFMVLVVGLVMRALVVLFA